MQQNTISDCYLNVKQNSKMEYDNFALVLWFIEDSGT